MSGPLSIAQEKIYVVARPSRFGKYRPFRLSCGGVFGQSKTVFFHSPVMMHRNRLVHSICTVKLINVLDVVICCCKTGRPPVRFWWGSDFPSHCDVVLGR